ncbi:uncharacterized protein C10orf105-like [Brachionichthys hirsutus]|uniref:uncharacterized protein C10orf105-like n=1 Tax=Brachionichthys hirsutus TaxID=412623 RepID=UPI003604C7F5
MATTEPGFNLTFTSSTETLLTATATSPSILHPPSHPSESYDPHFTIMVVLGLSLLLAGLAAFLAVCRPSQQDGESEGSCGTGESWSRGGKQSSEPQLKVWKRLGSYRRAYNLSFRRPPHRRPRECESTRVSQTPVQQTPQPESGTAPHLTVPCLFDYVTEI